MLTFNIGEAATWPMIKEFFFSAQSPYSCIKLILLYQMSDSQENQEPNRALEIISHNVLIYALGLDRSREYFLIYLAIAQI